MIKALQIEKFIEEIFYRDHSTKFGTLYIKDLRVINKPMKDLVFIDVRN